MKHTLNYFAFILAIMGSTSAWAQIDCESFKSIPLDPKIKTFYSPDLLGENHIFDMNFLNLFESSDHYFYLTSFQPGEVHLEKYTAEIELVKKNDIAVDQNKNNSYFGVEQLGEHIYLFYLEHAGKGSKTAVLNAQEFDLTTLQLKPEKISIFTYDDDVQLEHFIMPGEFTSPILALRFSEDRNYLGLFLLDENEAGNIEFKVSINDSDLKQQYFNSIVTDFEIKSYVRAEFIVGDNGFAAITSTTENKSSKARHPYHSSTVYTLIPQQSSATMKMNELETDEYTASEVFPIIAGNRLFVYTKLDRFGAEDWEYDYKFFVYDLTSDSPPSVISAMIFDYLPENEIITFHKPDRQGGYKTWSREFNISGFDIDPEGNIYLCFNYLIDYDNRDVPASYSTIPRAIDNPKGIPVNVPAILKLDKNLQPVLAHMFYFSEYPADEIVFENSNAHVFVDSFNNIELPVELNLKEKRKEYISAGRDENQIRSDIRFDTNGKVTINNIDDGCSLNLGQRTSYNFIYSTSTGKCFSIMGGEGNEESLYLASFKFSN